MSRNPSDLHDDAIVLDVLTRAWNAGCPVAKPSPGLASAAARRCRSIANRNVALTDRPGRLRDLAKGLVAFHGETPGSIGRLMVDYEYVADLILTALDSKN